MVDTNKQVDKSNAVGRGIANHDISPPSHVEIKQRGEGDLNPCVLSDMGLAIQLAKNDDNALKDTWVRNVNGFTDYLKTNNKRNINQILAYARSFGYVLDTDDASAIVSLSGYARRHVLEALVNYAKYTGRYDQFQQIRKRHNLKWTSGDESLQSLQRFFSQDLTFDIMLDKVREMIRVLPPSKAAIIEYATITGLRATEAIESVKLLNNEETCRIYYDKEQETLYHYKFPQQFLRPSKRAYISYLSVDNYARIANLGGKTPTPTWKAIRSACIRRNVKMNMKLTRRLFSSWLLQQGIPEVSIDFLSGRVSQSVFRNHYATPAQDLKVRVLDAVEKLRGKILP